MGLHNPPARYRRRLDENLHGRNHKPFHGRRLQNDNIVSSSRGNSQEEQPFRYQKAFSKKNKKILSLTKLVARLKRDLNNTNTRSANLNMLHSELAAWFHIAVSQSLMIQELQHQIDALRDANFHHLSAGIFHNCKSANAGPCPVMPVGIRDDNAGSSLNDVKEKHPSVSASEVYYPEILSNDRRVNLHPDAAVPDDRKANDVRISVDNRMDVSSMLENGEPNKNFVHPSLPRSEPSESMYGRVESVEVKLEPSNDADICISRSSVNADFIENRNHFGKQHIDILHEPMNLKIERLEDSDAYFSRNSETANFIEYKRKVEEEHADFLDNIPLHIRIKMRGSLGCALNMSSELLTVVKANPCKIESNSNVEYIGPIFSRNLEEKAGEHEGLEDDASDSRRFKLPRKRRKTCTNSVKTALEEDAPGLIQVLSDTGVNVDDIMLYGFEDDIQAIDILEESNFVDLEAIISKIFVHSSHLLKLRGMMKGSKASYYLGCLIALVEHVQHLQHKDWPVEWGWCRDLQAFIFIFTRHNRIVLERPEYGYATYFFELVGSMSIKWQIMRLITTMKLGNCSRLSLLENRPLVVGEDLSDGEAQVLEGYGWRPNTGLGSMLNYLDRVVHDRKSDQESSYWKSKIGKLLLDGYRGGTLLLTELPKRVLSCSAE